ncbi:MAG: MogA/MoaB family molybdenum cofactor biosynthesis protein [Acidimicrobiia bacterium]
MVAAVLTVSDGVSRGYREDGSGAALVELLESEGFTVTARKVVPDDATEIAGAISDLSAQVPLVVTTGGTGLGPRDVTPEATRVVLDREAPGLVMLMLSEAIRQNPMAALSRAVVGTRGASLVVNLPGSPRGAVENLTALLPILPHALALLAGDTEHRPPPA